MAKNNQFAGLSDKQAAFAREYLIDLNATKAAIRAGYSKKTAGQQGERLLKKVEIARVVQQAMDERSKETGITAAKVLADIERVRNLAESGGEYNTALKASELQGKHLKLFTDKVQHEGDMRITVVTGIDSPPGCLSDRD
jgi:phage terminase small subunit